MSLGSQFRLPRVWCYPGLFVEVAVLVVVLIRVKEREIRISTIRALLFVIVR
jgi:hypothetical protein